MCQVMFHVDSCNCGNLSFLLVPGTKGLVSACGSSPCAQAGGIGADGSVMAHEGFGFSAEGKYPDEVEQLPLPCS